MKKTGNHILLLLTLINLFNYLDRYILVALSPTIKHEMLLSDTQVGFLTTAFMLTYFLCSPLFGWLGDRKPRFKVMAVGVGLWSLATAASGMAARYLTLLYSRFFVGVGEAAYGTISPALLTDLYPKSKRGKTFAIFYMAIPVGSALGFLLGGLLEKLVGWKAAFFVAGFPGVLLALSLLFLTEPKRGQFEDEEDIAQKAISLTTTYKELAKNSNYVFTVLGYCAYTFVVGGVAVWIPHYMERYLSIEPAKGNMLFGAITVAGGFLGTMVGGSWADRWAARSGDAYLKLSALSMFAAVPVYLIMLQTRSLATFSILVFLLEFLLFLSTSPINAQIVNCVPVLMRASASAVSIFMIHLLGDAVSPPLIGFVSDRVDLHWAMYFFVIGILGAGIFWFSKLVFFWETLPWSREMLQLPHSQCHRGYHLEGLQENTLAAFREAKARGAVMIELDVRLSKDGIPVVIHDVSIDRVSAASGLNKKGLVAELCAVELKTLAHAPSLEEVLRDSAVPSLVNIELKTNSAKDNGLEAAVAKVVQSVNAENRVLFSSFNPLALRRISNFLPNVPRALLATNEDDPENKFYLRKMLLTFLARPHMVNLDQQMLSEKVIATLLGRGVKIATWTVNDSQKAQNFLRLGVTSVISDRTDLLEQ